MGKKFPVLKLRDVIAILQLNGFTPGLRGGTSHVHYHGRIDGQHRSCTVDMSIDDWTPRNRTVLHYLVKSQLRISYDRFYAGHPTTAKREPVS